jgi:hypothetical protein
MITKESGEWSHEVDCITFAWWYNDRMKLLPGKPRTMDATATDKKVLTRIANRLPITAHFIPKVDTCVAKGFVVDDGGDFWKLTKLGLEALKS